MHSAKEIVILYGLLALIVGYVDMITYPLTKYYYIIERVYFNYRLFILFISTFSFLSFFYTLSWGYKKDYLNPSIGILFYIMFYIINTMKLNIRQFYTTFLVTIQKRLRFEPGSPSPLFVATPPVRVGLLCNIK